MKRSATKGPQLSPCADRVGAVRELGAHLLQAVRGVRLVALHRRAVRLGLIEDEGQDPLASQVVEPEEVAEEESTSA